MFATSVGGMVVLPPRPSARWRWLPVGRAADPAVDAAFPRVNLVVLVLAGEVVAEPLPPEELDVVVP